MRIGIYANAKRDKDLAATKKFIGMLKKDGVDFLAADFPELNGGIYASREDLAERCSLIVVFGGDGTILNVVLPAAEKGVPLLGINTGNLGFLTETDASMLETAAAAIKSRAYTTESRSMIEAEIIRRSDTGNDTEGRGSRNKNGDKKEAALACGKVNIGRNFENAEKESFGKTGANSGDGNAALCGKDNAERSFENDGKRIVYPALNEIVLKETAFKMARFKLSVDGFLVDNYHSDGVLVSTPTGSTAYSLSVGGPVLAPNVGAFIINPVNAHSLHSRPIVVSDDSVIEVETPTEGGLRLIADGICAAEAGCGEIIRIKKSQNSAVFAKISDGSFYTRLLRKFNSAK
ncbi:MAG: NAD(+)/NADH kinase [Clostridiales bacterium]|jgi:NAD kinase|nr:NAD(+)/NADH kinase [Clostridiales bacterium]